MKKIQLIIALLLFTSFGALAQLHTATNTYSGNGATLHVYVVPNDPAPYPLDFGYAGGGQNTNSSYNGTTLYTNYSEQSRIYAGYVEVIYTSVPTGSSPQSGDFKLYLRIDKDSNGTFYFVENDMPSPVRIEYY